MAFLSEFTDIALDDLHREAAVMKVEGWRFIQTHAVNTDDGVDLYYSFMKDGAVCNLAVRGVQKDQPVPSVTDLFLAAFVFENEARELFGVDMRDIAIDFAGALYAPAESEPMTFMTPEQKAARDKARKAQAAKAAKASEAPAAASADAPAPAAKGFVMTPERQERLNAKMAGMAPEKIAKIEAALKARAAEAPAAPAEAKPADAPAKAEPKPAATASDAEKPASEPSAPSAPTVDEQLEAKIALLGDEKAAKVRAAIARRSGEPAPDADEQAQPQAALALDDQLEAKLSVMDADKAAKVRAALAAKAAREASSKGGE